MPRATVLLADDHPIVVEGLASLLSDEFALVGTVTNGAQLIEAARRLRPDVIVTDVGMPGMSGLEALRRLKADAIPAKVVFLTMHADAQLAAEALRAGASGFVVKHAAGRSSSPPSTPSSRAGHTWRRSSPTTSSRRWPSEGRRRGRS